MDDVTEDESTQATAVAEGAARLEAPKLKYIADVMKSLAVVLTGAAVVTPAFTGRPLGTLNYVWVLVASALILAGFVVTPRE